MFGTRRMIAMQPSGLLIPLNRLLAKFPGGNEVVLRGIVIGPDTTWDMFQAVGNGRYFRANIRGADLSVGQEYMRNYVNTGIADYYRGYTINSTPALTNSGPFTYTAGSYIGGGYHRTTTAGYYLELTSEAGVSWLGAACAASFTGAGLFLAAIDGDTTLANLLPTAQSLVDGGSFANTILVANGGTLNPTDRVWDTYNRTSNNGVYNGYIEIFTKSLTAGVHTLRLTFTGYKNVAAGALFNGICVLMSGGPGASGVTGIGAGVASIWITTPLVFSSTCWEVSWSYQPTGATGHEWIGHTGSLKIASAPSVTVDGAAVTPTNGSINVGSTIVISTSNNVRHTETGATNNGALTLTYTMNKSTGFTIAHSLAFAVSGVLNAYPCMMDVLHAQFDRFTTIGATSSGDLTDNDDAVNFNSSSSAGYCWKDGGNIAMMMNIPDLALTTGNWADAPTNRLWWADVAGGSWKKLYTTRFQSDTAFTNATVLASAANYRLAYFPSGVGATFPIV